VGRSRRHNRRCGHPEVEGLVAHPLEVQSGLNQWVNVAAAFDPEHETTAGNAEMVATMLNALGAEEFIASKNTA
jgi:hypothetical protein